MKRSMMITLACAVFGTALPVHANDDHHPQAEAQKHYEAKGNVVAVEKAAGKLKLRHDAIPELKWPEMTMFFAVADKSQLDTLQPGDLVSFEFVTPKGGAPLITQVKPVQ